MSRLPSLMRRQVLALVGINGGIEPGRGDAQLAQSGDLVGHQGDER
jgi:hypothetical protein